MSSTHSPNRSSALSSLSPPPPPPPTLSPLPNLPSSPFLFHNPIFDNTEYVVKKLHPASFNHNSPTTVEFKESLVRAIQKDPSRLPSHLILLPPSPRFTRYSPKSAASPLPSPPTPPSEIPKSRNCCERSRGGSVGHEPLSFSLHHPTIVPAIVAAISRIWRDEGRASTRVT